MAKTGNSIFGEQIDFIIITETGKVIALDAKMSAHTARPITIPPSFKKLFKDVSEIILISFTGQNLHLSEECRLVPLSALYDFLANIEPNI